MRDAATEASRSGAAGFSWPTRVYWEDTDAGGVVYHAQYLAFLERARTEWLRAQGWGQERLRRDYGLVFAVRAMTLDFRQPARLDDALDVGVRLAECRRASLVIAQTIDREGRRLIDAEVRVAALAASTFRPMAIPDDLLSMLRSQESPAPGDARRDEPNVERIPR
ncbi:MAG: tol-pal system-associated acyl-CoA thioesterase [Lysobacteraceae bacterium]